MSAVASTRRHAEIELILLGPDPDALDHYNALAVALNAKNGKECENCAKSFTRTRAESSPHWAARRFCSRSCAGAWSARRGAEMRRQAAIEDVEWIIDTDHPERVAQRLGYASAASLERMLQRWRRYDLAAKLRAEAFA